MRITREERTLEAERNNYRGQNGKIFTIVRYLGQRMFYHIMDDGDGLFPEEGPKPEVRSSADDQIIVDPEDGEGEGWYYDGLRWGIHMEIIQSWPESRLTVYYKGYKVFEEIDGFLEAYAPNPEWENHIEHLFKVASKHKVGVKQAERQEKQEIKRKRKLSFWQAMRENWGL